MQQTTSDRSLFGWNILPSGWFKSGKNNTQAFIFENGDRYHWWIKKNNVTMKEGIILRLSGRVKIEKILASLG